MNESYDIFHHAYICQYWNTELFTPCSIHAYHYTHIYRLSDPSIFIFKSLSYFRAAPVFDMPGFRIARNKDHF